MKILLMKNVKYNYKTVVIANDGGGIPDAYLDDEHVALTEVLDVDFKPISEKETTAAQVNVIERQITKVRAAAEASLTVLEGRKQELLAITYNESSEDA